MVQPFAIHVSDAEIEQLQARLRATRWPDPRDLRDPAYGVNADVVGQLVRRWADGYSWRQAEAELNQWPGFLTNLDGQPIHYLHVRSAEPNALPLLLMHGWPGSIYEFHQVIDPLTDPAKHGGRAADAFDVVCLALPGYGWSGPTMTPGWDVARAARVAGELMSRLGYRRYGVQGGDWGALAAIHLAGIAPDQVVGVHVNMLPFGRPPGWVSDDGLSPRERGYLARRAEMAAAGSGYSAIQRTRPSTLAYALTDSPVGQLAWIVDKFAEWSDCDGDVLRSFTPDQLLTNASIYWFTRTAGSSGRLYYESAKSGAANLSGLRIDIPTGCALFPCEPLLAPRSWVEAVCNVTWWTEMPKGGHFAAFEQPELFIRDVRAFFATLR